MRHLSSWLFLSLLGLAAPSRAAPHEPVPPSVCGAKLRQVAESIESAGRRQQATPIHQIDLAARAIDDAQDCMDSNSIDAGDYGRLVTLFRQRLSDWYRTDPERSALALLNESGQWLRGEFEEGRAGWAETWLRTDPRLSCLKHGAPPPVEGISPLTVATIESDALASALLRRPWSTEGGVSGCLLEGYTGALQAEATLLTSTASRGSSKENLEAQVRTRVLVVGREMLSLALAWPAQSTNDVRLKLGKPYHDYLIRLLQSEYALAQLYVDAPVLIPMPESASRKTNEENELIGPSYQFYQRVPLDVLAREIASHDDMNIRSLFLLRRVQETWSRLFPRTGEEGEPAVLYDKDEVNKDEMNKDEVNKDQVNKDQVNRRVNAAGDELVAALAATDSRAARLEALAFMLEQQRLPALKATDDKRPDATERRRRWRLTVHAASEFGLCLMNRELLAGDGPPCQIRQLQTVAAVDQCPVGHLAPVFDRSSASAVALSPRVALAYRGVLMTLERADFPERRLAATTRCELSRLAAPAVLDLLAFDDSALASFSHLTMRRALLPPELTARLLLRALSRIEDERRDALSMLGHTQLTGLQAEFEKAEGARQTTLARGLVQACELTRVGNGVYQGAIVRPNDEKLSVMEEVGHALPPDTLAKLMRFGEFLPGDQKYCTVTMYTSKLQPGASAEVKKKKGGKSH